MRGIKAAQAEHERRQGADVGHDPGGSVILCADCDDLGVTGLLREAGRASWWDRPRAALLGLVVASVVQAWVIADASGLAEAVAVAVFGVTAVMLGVMWERYPPGVCRHGRTGLCRDCYRQA